MAIINTYALGDVTRGSKLLGTGTSQEGTANFSVGQLENFILGSKGDRKIPVTSQVDFTTAEPTAYLEGSRYINTVTGPASSSGTYVIANNIYEAINNSWVETVVSIGFTVWDIALSKNFSYDGSAWTGDYVSSAQLDLKADKATTYTEVETDALLSAKADQSTTYTIIQVDNALVLKADAAATTQALGLKADQATTYTIAQVNTELAQKTNVTTFNTAIAGLEAGQAGGLLSFVTLAALQAYASPTTTDSYKVTNDTTSSNNGFYHYVGGGSFVKDADLVQNTISETNTSEGVSGQAVYNELLFKGPHQGSLNGDYFPLKDMYFRNSTAAFTSLAGKQASYYIPFTPADTMLASGTVKGGAFSNASFFDENKVRIGSGYDLPSNVPVLELNSSNTPAGTAFVVLNSDDASVSSQSVTINGISNVSESVLSIIAKNTEQDTTLLFSPAGQGIVDGSFKSLGGDGFFMHKTTGVLTASAAWAMTQHIPFTNADVLVATGTKKTTSANNVNFLDENKNFISSIEFPSAQETITINTGNTPAATKYLILNYQPGTSLVKATINGAATLVDSVAALQNLESLPAAVDDISSAINGNYFTVVGYRNNTTGALATSPTIIWRTTNFLPFTNADDLVATGTVKAGSAGTINFYDVSKNFISSFSLQSNTPVLSVGPLADVNAPTNTAFVTLNSQVGIATDLSINGLRSVQAISEGSPVGNITGKRITFYGDSLTANTVWEQEFARITGGIETVRGVGSSGMSIVGPTRVAIESSGQYISRRDTFNNENDYISYLATKGFTSLVTTPTWIEYSNNPTGYTLPSGSYFEITSKGSGQERINTLPVDSEIVSIMFGTNDYASATLGNISSYDDGTFMGEYRACIDKIKLRCPNTMIIVCVPPRRTAEYSTSNNSITTAGTTFNSMRAMIRNMNDSYGFVQVDFSNIWNYSNINVYSADGTHPNDAGRKLMGQHYSRMVQVAPV